VYSNRGHDRSVGPTADHGEFLLTLSFVFLFKKFYKSLFCSVAIGGYTRFFFDKHREFHQDQVPVVAKLKQRVFELKFVLAR
jgi:hypothetical protein